MPTYSYICTKCGASFELFFTIKEYNEHPQCIGCKSQQTIRDYITDTSSQTACIKKNDTELKTVGDLANRNRDRLSADEKQHLHKKHNSYKEYKEDKPLPKGMSRIPKPPKITWNK